MQTEERGLIGCILLDEKVLDKVFELVKPEMFIEQLAGEAYAKALLLHAKNEDVNAVSLIRVLEDIQYTKEDLNVFLIDCAKTCVSSAYAKDYAKTIRQSFKVRQARAIIESNIDILTSNVDGKITTIMSELDALLQERESKARKISDIALELKDTFFCEQPDRTISGFYKLDEMIGGFEGGNVYVIGARPAVGKSAYAIQMILQMARRGKKVGYFNLELKERQVLARMISSIANIRMDRLKNAKAFLGDEEPRYNKAIEELNKLDIDVISSITSLTDLKTICKYQNYDVVIIDYLQLMKSDKSYANRANEVGFISKTIKEISMELNIPIIVLSQLNRVMDETKEPSMTELRESGDIEQDASVVMLLWNLSDDRRNKGLKIDKNRDGACGKIGYQFKGELVRFEESMEDFYKFNASSKSNEKSVSDLENYNPFK